MKRYPCQPSALSVKIILFTLLVAALGGCAASSNPDVERGSTYKYRPGYPQVRFSAAGFLNQANKARINVAADIVYGSLVFKQKNGKEQADITLDIRVVSKDNTDNIINSTHKEVHIKKKGESIIHSQDLYSYQHQIAVSPGNYIVYLTVTDQTSGKKITRQSATEIPDPASNTIDLTDIRMLAKDMDQPQPHWTPLTTYDVPGKIDSLMFILQVTNNASDQPLTVKANLIRFDSDSSVARPMFYNNYSHSSIEYHGIDFDDKTTVQQATRKLIKQGSVQIEFRFAQQQRGNYRFAVRSSKKNNDLFKARDFSVKSTNYPALKTARELARPLTYLMDKDHYQDLMSIQDKDSLKAAMDRFWLKHIGSKNKARNVLKLYYQRVEEANKQFSNFKEGWKTDPGMIYILFGPPWYVEQHLDRMEWSYAYNRQDPDRNFFFKQYKLKSKFYPFIHYVLLRDQSYFNVEYQQRQLWLSGLILQRSL